MVANACHTGSSAIGRPSPFEPGTSTSRAYNHYSLLGSIEDLFGLPRLGYARTVSDVFGNDVYNAS